MLTNELAVGMLFAVAAQATIILFDRSRGRGRVAHFAGTADDRGLCLGAGRHLALGWQVCGPQVLADRRRGHGRAGRFRSQLSRRARIALRSIRATGVPFLRRKVAKLGTHLAQKL